MSDDDTMTPANGQPDAPGDALTVGMPATHAPEGPPGHPRKAWMVALGAVAAIVVVVGGLVLLTGGDDGTTSNALRTRRVERRTNRRSARPSTSTTRPSVPTTIGGATGDGSPSTATRDRSGSRSTGGTSTAGSDGGSGATPITAMATPTTVASSVPLPPAIRSFGLTSAGCGTAQASTTLEASWSVENAQSIWILINGVRQSAVAPNDAETVTVPCEDAVWDVQIEAVGSSGPSIFSGKKIRLVCDVSLVVLIGCSVEPA